MERDPFDLGHRGGQLKDLAVRNSAVGLENDFPLAVAKTVLDRLFERLDRDPRPVAVAKNDQRFASTS